MPPPYAIVAGDFAPWGGMDRPNYELALHLAARGSEVRLVAHRVAAPLRDHPNVSWDRVPRPLGRHALGSPLLDLRGRRAARRAAADGGTSVVNGGNCPVGEVNWVHYLHDAPGRPRPAGPAPRRLWSAAAGRRDRRRERSALAAARLVVADSEMVRGLLIGRLGLDPGRVRTIYYGVDAEAFRPATGARRGAARRALGLPADRPVVAFVGALGADRRKGFDVLFEAWRLLAADGGWDAVLAAAGAGAELPLWRRRAAEAGLGESVRMLGFTAAVPDLLAAADALASPTRFEPYGQGVHEALCAGLPALVTRSAGVSERYPADLSDLLLDDPPTAADLRDRLRAWRLDVEGAGRRVAPFADRLRSRSWSDMAAEFVGAVEGAVG